MTIQKTGNVLLRDHSNIPRTAQNRRVCIKGISVSKCERAAQITIFAVPLMVLTFLGLSMGCVAVNQVYPFTDCIQTGPHSWRCYPSVKEQAVVLVLTVASAVAIARKLV